MLCTTGCPHCGVPTALFRLLTCLSVCPPTTALQVDVVAGSCTRGEGAHWLLEEIIISFHRHVFCLSSGIMAPYNNIVILTFYTFLHSQWLAGDTYPSRTFRPFLMDDHAAHSHCDITPGQKMITLLSVFVNLIVATCTCIYHRWRMGICFHFNWPRRCCDDADEVT